MLVAGVIFWNSSEKVLRLAIAGRTLFYWSFWPVTKVCRVQQLQRIFLFGIRRTGRLVVVSLAFQYEGNALI